MVEVIDASPPNSPLQDEPLGEFDEVGDLAMVVWNSGIGVEGAMAIMVDGGAPDVVNGDLDMVPTGNIAQGMHPTIHVPPLAVVPMLVGHHALR